MDKNDKSSNGKNINSDNLFMVDADLLPLFEKARNGCLDSQLKLVIAFNDGERAKKNEKLTSELEKLIFKTADDSKLKLAALWNPAIREFEKGNYNKMIEKFNIVIDFMQENIPMEKWDFSLFAIMEECTQLKE